jgi:type IV pilus assembly protein PilX
MKTRHLPRPPAKGVTLIILLIMLVVVTLVTLSSLRSTTLDEKMAGNSRDRQRAFQAAEAAVQDCLERLEANTIAEAKKNDPATGADAPLWEVAANWTDNAAKSVEVTVTQASLKTGAGYASNPRCLIEKLDASNKSYRVTGRAVGGSADSVVMLQATISKE